MWYTEIFASVCPDLSRFETLCLVLVQVQCKLPFFHSVIDSAVTAAAAWQSETLPSPSDLPQAGAELCCSLASVLPQAGPGQNVAQNSHALTHAHILPVSISNSAQLVLDLAGYSASA